MTPTWVTPASRRRPPGADDTGMDEIVDRDRLIGWHEMYLAQLCVDRLLAGPDRVTRMLV